MYPEINQTPVPSIISSNYTTRHIFHLIFCYISQWEVNKCFFLCLSDTLLEQLKNHNPLQEDCFVVCVQCYTLSQAQKQKAVMSNF